MFSTTLRFWNRFIEKLRWDLYSASRVDDVRAISTCSKRFISKRIVDAKALHFDVDVKELNWSLFLIRLNRLSADNYIDDKSTIVITFFRQQLVLLMFERSQYAVIIVDAVCDLFIYSALRFWSRFIEKLRWDLYSATRVDSVRAISTCSNYRWVVDLFLKAVWTSIFDCREDLCSWKWVKQFHIVVALELTIKNINWVYLRSR